MATDLLESPEEEKSAEKIADKSADSKDLREQEDSLYNPKDSSRRSLRDIDIKKVAISKWGIAGAASGVIVIIGIVLLMFLATQLVPGLAANILTYQFARVGRAFADDNLQVVSESAAVNAAQDETEATGIRAKFSSLNDGMFQKIKNLNPQNVYDNFQQNGEIKFNYKPNKLGFNRLSSVTIGEQEIAVTPTTTSSFAGNIFHPIDTFKNNVDLANKVSTAMKTIMPENGIGVIARGAVEQKIMDDISAPRVAWLASKYGKDNAQQAEIQQAQDAEQAINPGAKGEPSVVDPINNAVTDGTAAIEEAVTNDQETLLTIQNGGIPPKIPPLLDGVANQLSNGAVSKTLSTVNTLYAIMLPLCIIYDGSITSNSASSINATSAEQERSFFYLESAADQQKHGATNAQAVGALNKKLGDVGASNPILRATGDPVNTTNNSISPQSGGFGTYTFINTLVPSSLAGSINAIGTSICPVITNPAAAGGITIAQIALWFATDGGAAAAEEAVSQGGFQTTLSGIIGRIVAISDNRGITEAAGARTAGLVSKLGEVIKPSKSDVVKIAGISGLDVLVRLDTEMKMHSTNDGFSQGNDLANQSEAGGIINSNKLMQQQFYGAPLSPRAVSYNNIEDKKFIALENSRKSVYDRYFSASNPSSLVAKIGFMASAKINASSFQSFFTNTANLLNPRSLISGIASLINPNAKVLADSVSSKDNTNYGIVQWGFTDEEQNLLHNSPLSASFQPLENDAILSQFPNAVSYIGQVYSPCFTSDMGTLLTQNPSSGPDNGNPYIVRNADGDVISGPSGGLCSNYYLGPNSADIQAYDTTDNKNDLIFRWRLQQAYLGTANTLTGLANVKAH
jgi:hypothetical protein